ncbi:hypothetical protein V6N13_048944 [Hibiscus sabdariffa]
MGRKLRGISSLPFWDWFLKNLSDNSDFALTRKDWSCTFAVLCWKLWKRRNLMLFSDDFEDNDDLVIAAIRFVRMIKEIEMSSSHPIGQQVTRIPGAEGWKKPRGGWIKLNVDGAVRWVVDELASIMRSQPRGEVIFMAPPFEVHEAVIREGALVDNLHED